uniref:Uncharacterized protein n=1 Tax=Sphaerodactylus townsendi TaxID=933632 RepID=A0ACB8FIR7_9SAUR
MRTGNPCSKCMKRTDQVLTFQHSDRLMHLRFHKVLFVIFTYLEANCPVSYIGLQLNYWYLTKGALTLETFCHTSLVSLFGATAFKSCYSAELLSLSMILGQYCV